MRKSESSKRVIELFTSKVGFNNISVHLQRYAKLTGWLYTGTNWIRVEPYLMKHLVRFERNTPMCSNHIESIHKHIKAKVKPLDTFVKRIMRIKEYITAKESNSRVNYMKNAQRTVYEMKKRKQELLSRGFEHITNPECHCSEFLFLSSLYGCEFTCIHRITAESAVPRLNPIPDFNKTVQERMIVIVSDDDIVSDRRMKFNNSEKMLISKYIFDGTDDAIYNITDNVSKRFGIDFYQSSLYVAEARHMICEKEKLCWNDERVYDYIRVFVYTDNQLINDYKGQKTSGNIVSSISEESYHYSANISEMDPIPTLPSGLFNLGFTCYFNSSVQLSATMVTYFEDNRTKDRVSDELFKLLLDIERKEEGGRIIPESAFFTLSMRYKHYRTDEENSAITCFKDILCSLIGRENPAITMHIVDNNGEVSNTYLDRNVICLYEHKATSSMQDLIEAMLANISKGMLIEPPRFLGIETDRDMIIFDHEMNPIAQTFYNGQVTIELSINVKHCISAVTGYRLLGFIERVPLANSSGGWHYITKRLYGKSFTNCDDCEVKEIDVTDSFLSRNCVYVLYENSYTPN